MHDYRVMLTVEVLMSEQVTYTSYEAARILHVDESTIRRRCMAGKMIGAYRGVLRTKEIWMIPASALGLGESIVIQDNNSLQNSEDV
jgi:hypothetical protein